MERAGQPCWLPGWREEPGPAGITILVIAAVASPATGRAVGAAVEIPGGGSVGRVVGASPAARGGGEERDLPDPVAGGESSRPLYLGFR